LRDNGQSRVPEPPARMTGVTCKMSVLEIGMALFVQWKLTNL
jgi:hypothetical protein